MRKRRTWSTRSGNPSRSCGGIFDWDTANARLKELNALAEDPGLWNDTQKARAVMRERQHLDDAINAYADLERSLSDNVELIELGEEEGDSEVVAEAEKALGGLLKTAQKREVEALLSGEADGNDAYVEVHAGAGGTESQDWAQMLLRMYMRWAEEKRFKTELMETSPGEEAGLKSATLLVKGTNAYGWLKTEFWCAPPGAYLAFRFQRAAPYQLRFGLGLSRRRRHHQHRDQRERVPHRYLSLKRRGRPACQHHGLRGTHHPSAHRHCRAVPKRALAA